VFKNATEYDVESPKTNVIDIVPSETSDVLSTVVPLGMSIL
jgi:hypothetical protein